MVAKAYIGTSGWSYNHWRGIFYPEKLPQKSWLEYYATCFNTVELNSPFYRLPKRDAFRVWAEKSPPNFIFSVKASRFITHIKKLAEPAHTLPKFFESIDGLGAKCGPVLFQLPPNFKADAARLELFVSHLPAGRKYSFEFRHPSWFRAEIYSILSASAAALCFSSAPDYPLEFAVLTSFLYCRLHGSRTLYASAYLEEELDGWASIFKTHMEMGLDIYVYFDNDYRAYAVKNALELMGRLSGYL